LEIIVWLDKTKESEIKGLRWTWSSWNVSVDVYGIQRVEVTFIIIAKLQPNSFTHCFLMANKDFYNDTSGSSKPNVCRTTERIVWYTRLKAFEISVKIISNCKFFSSAIRV